MPLDKMSLSYNAILKEVRACTLCASHLPLTPKPVVQLHPNAQILIAGQAPGRKVHDSGIPFNDASGQRLRRCCMLPCVKFVFSEPRLSVSAV